MRRTKEALQRFLEKSPFFSVTTVDLRLGQAHGILKQQGFSDSYGSCGEMSDSLYWNFIELVLQRICRTMVYSKFFNETIERLRTRTI